MPDDDALGATEESLAKFGIQRMPVAKAIRAKCLDCAGTWHEVEKCECAGCPLWPFRFGRDPWRRSREMTEEERAAAGARLAAARAARS